MAETLRAMMQDQFSVTGTIMHGKQLGRTIRFPTANLQCPICDDLPPNGVHIAVMEVFSGPYAGQVFPCVLNQGHQPTAPSGITTVEAYVLDFSGDLYDAEAKMTYLHFLRPETRFPSLEALKNQLARDAQTAREYFDQHNLFM